MRLNYFGEEVKLNEFPFAALCSLTVNYTTRIHF